MKFSGLVRNLFLLASLRSAVADDEGEGEGLEPLLDSPVEIWSAQLFPDIDLGAVDVEAGNGVFMAPDGKHALVTTIGATVYAFNAYSGEQAWVYQPEAVGTGIARSHSGITYGPLGNYMVYAVVDNENSMSPSSRVIALDMEGNELWVSDDLEGVIAGCPQVSSDGAYVYLTHNADGLSNGYFTILDGATGGFFYGGSSGEALDNPTKRYGPVGIFHSPESGNYDPITAGAPVSEGDFNTNDMLMWSQSPKPTDESIQNGYLYGFQFPRDFAGNASEISYFQIGSFERDFQTITPPVMTNGGMSAYWAVSRSGFRGWTPKRFSRARDVSIGFSRNDDFPGQPVWATPALSNDGPEPFIFGGTAAKEFVKMNWNFGETVVVPTEGYVKSKALIDGEERAVYYVESDNGLLHGANFLDITDMWTIPMNFTVYGEMALTPRSDVLIVADTRGVITAYQVAEILITASPSEVPSDGPSLSPTMKPSISFAPVVPVPTEAPVATEVPVAPPTEAPVVPPVATEPKPVPVPVPAPTSSGASRSLLMASAAVVISAMLM
eukprot:CAMPEP_0172361548 /NCGR_PEP_ID=MMETSP1060-20121228/5354_1 /TAXON_ID=37318 /ORGANISM="Pseudo-nitzschia pungens, Strain cf. cingulata" /LENGTH=552 /DNA_ID=CAMNT_0013083835 /DNA_START=26 /DNA_END=1684 /DNA_ORIENTATION=-